MHMGMDCSKDSKHNKTYCNQIETNLGDVYVSF